MKLPNRFKAGIAVVGVAAVGLLLFEQRDTYKCPACHSMKDIVQWRLGIQPSPSVAVSPASQRVRMSLLASSFFPAGHQHAWQYFNGSTRGAGGRSCSCTFGLDSNDFVVQYERDADFRLFVRRKLDSRAVTVAQIIAICALPRWDWSDAGLDSEPLIAIAQSLLRGVNSSN